MFLCRFHRSLFGHQFRCFLSSAYACQTQWEARREHLDKLRSAPLDPYDYIAEMQKRAADGIKPSAVDVDILANSINDSDQLPELKNFIYALRHSDLTSDTLDSTHDAVVRSFLEYNQADKLVEILDDTINYGIFPSTYACNLLTSNFISNDKWHEAAKMGWHLMRQEMFDNVLSCYLAIYTSSYWLNSLQNQEKRDQDASGEQQEEDEDYIEDEAEEMMFKVPYLKNPIFDSHFDVTDERLLCGKTLWWMGEQIDPQTTATRSAALLGLVIFCKPDEIEPQLGDFVSTHNGQFLTQVIEQIMEIIRARDETEHFEDVERLLNKIAALKNADSGSLLECIETELKSMQKHLEAPDINAQKDLFIHWNRVRKDTLNAQVIRHARRLRLKQIESERKELEEKENLLFFFENRDDWEREVDLEALKAEQKGVDIMQLTDEEYARKLSEHFHASHSTNRQLRKKKRF